VRGFTRFLIHESFAGRTLNRTVGALGILDANGAAVVIAEIELCEIAMQMCLADVMINAIDAAL
jgi:hypothetical protein